MTEKARHLQLAIYLSSMLLLEGFQIVPQHPGEKLFVHIPKNAGTYVSRILHERGWDLFDYPAPGVACSTWHTPPSLVIETGQFELLPGDRFFAVLRHPYERAVSQWSWGLEMWKGLNYASTKEGMNQFIQDSIVNASRTDCDATATNLGRGPALHFCGRYAQDCHWLPQSDYVFDQGYKHRLVETLLRQENLTAELQAFFGDWENKQRHDVAWSVDSMHFAEDGVSSATFANWLCHLTDTTKAMLEEHYAKDFKHFGFATTRGLDSNCS